MILIHKNINDAKFFMLFCMLMFSYTSMFAQNEIHTNKEKSCIDKNETNVISTKDNLASTDFTVWYMGTRENGKENESNLNSTNFGKKQLMNSGINTKNVLIRAFLKKVVYNGTAVS